MSDDLRWSTLLKLLFHVIRKRKGSKPFIIGYYTGMGRENLSDNSFGISFFLVRATPATSQYRRRYHYTISKCPF